MVAELAPEFPLHPEQGRGQLFIPHHERQEVKIDRHKVGRHLGSRASCAAFMPVEYSSSDIWNIYVNGCTGTGRGYILMADADSQLGKNSAAIDVSRGMAINDIFHPKKMLEAELYQAEDISAVLDRIQKIYGVELFNLIGHSMGGRAVVGLAEKEPERIAGVVLANAAGLEKHNLWTMSTERLPEFFRDDLTPNFGLIRDAFGNDLMMAVDYIWHNVSNPVRTVVEALSIASANIEDRVVALGAKDDIKTVILNTEADKLTPNKGVKARFEGLVDYVGVHPNDRFGHFALQTDAYAYSKELHDIDHEIDPIRVRAPREFSVEAMTRVTNIRRSALHVPRIHVPVPHLHLSKAS